MFTRVPDASKIALAALVAWSRQAQVPMIDCQQNTRHLASLGAREIARRDFVREVAQQSVLPAVRWQFEPVYWDELLPHTSPA
jgi:leucyl/phenylalanyl-tRNA--protein transferase